MLHRIYDLLTLIANKLVGPEDVSKMVLVLKRLLETPSRSPTELRMCLVAIQIEQTGLMQLGICLFDSHLTRTPMTDRTFDDVEHGVD